MGYASVGWVVLGGWFWVVFGVLLGVVARLMVCILVCSGVGFPGAFGFVV